MAPKRKEAPKAEAQPEPKKAKAEEAKAKATEKPKAEPAKAKAAEPPKAAAAAATEEKKVEEEKKEFEEPDAPADKRPAITETVTFDVAQTTMNVVATTGGKVLMSLADGGMQYLIAGARANTGVKGGRYMFEVKVVQALTPSDGSMVRGRATMPGQLVRVGFSVAGTHLILGDSPDSICFDSDGIMMADGKKKNVSQKFGREQAVAIVLNLDSKSPNYNKVSLYKDGVRICEPQELPASMRGKPLYPHVAFRNVSVQVNFGPAPLKALPFQCRMIQSAAKADVEVTKPQASKCEVVFPVAFPDEGTFEWLDLFLKKNPGYVELSERMIMDWAVKSGLWKSNRSSGPRHSNDKPEFNFGLPVMDDLSAKRVLYAIAPLLPRNYVVMEVKSNLVKDERKELLSKFSSAHFKKVCKVIMGDPNKEFKSAIQDKLLEEKQTKATKEYEIRKAEKERKKEAERRKKEMDEKRKKWEEERKKQMEEAKKKAEAEKAKKEEGETKMEVDESGEKPAAEESKEDAEMKTEEKKEEEVKEEEAKEEPKEEEEEEEPPVVELSEEEKSMKFRKFPAPDISEAVLTASFGKFTVPTKDEGFEAITYEWANEKASKEYLQKWVTTKKITARIEDLQPGEAFRTKVEEWQKLFTDWQKKQAEHKAAGKKKKEDGEDGGAADVDIYSVKDILDVGNGEPLFSNFEFEDWAMLSLRVEFWLLITAYKKDVDDEERLGIHEKNIDYYYQKYFRKPLFPNMYGKEKMAELLKLIKDTAVMDEDTEVLKLADVPAELDDFDNFAKFAEEQRRERQRRIDAGDEGGRLKFEKLSQMQHGTATTGLPAMPLVPPAPGRATPAMPGLAPPPASGAAPQWQHYSGGKKSDKDKGKGDKGYGYKGKGGGKARK